MSQMIKQGLSASSLLDRGVELMGESNRYLCQNPDDLMLTLLEWLKLDSFNDVLK